MIEFIRKKLENWKEFRALKKYLETGVIISGILTLGTMLIYIYKFSSLAFMGVPFQVSKSIVDVQNTDILIGIVCVTIYLLIIYIYYLLFEYKHILILFSTFIYSCISLSLKFNLYEYIWFIFLVQAISFMSAWCFREIWYGIKGIKRKKKETRLKEKINRIFEFLDRKISSLIQRKINEVDKDVVIERTNIIKYILEVVIVLTFLVIPVIFLALFISSYPSKKMIVNDKIVLYTSNDKFLVADYKIDGKMIRYDLNSLHLIQQEEVKIKFTDRVLGIRKEEESMAIKGAKTIQEYHIMKFIEKNFEEGSVYWKIIDDNTFQVIDKTGKFKTMTMDEIKE